MNYKIQFVILATLYSISCFGLELREKIDSKVLAFLPKHEVIVINRGHSDNIEKNQHIRMFYNNKFVGRAVAVDIDTYRSTWFVYFTDLPGIFKDSPQITIVRLPNRFTPRRVQAALRYINMPEINLKLNNLRIKQLENRTKFAKNEFTESQQEDEEKIPVIDPESELELNPGKKTIYEDPKDKYVDYLKFILEADPIKLISKDDEKKMDYSLRVESIDWGDKEFTAFYRYTHTNKRASNFGTASNTMIDLSKYHAGAQFDYNDIFPDWTWFCLADWKKERDGNINPYYYRLHLGPFGIKYNFYQSSSIDEISLSYVPLLEFIERDVINDDGTLDIFTDNYARHSFRFRFKWRPHYAFTLTDVAWYRPYHNLSDKHIDFKDVKFENNLTSSYQLSENFSISYSHIIIWDVADSENYGFPATIYENIFSFKYNFSI
jgi:hypothetical protein